MTFLSNSENIQVIGLLEGTFLFYSVCLNLPYRSTRAIQEAVLVDSPGAFKQKQEYNPLKANNKHREFVSH